MMNITPDEINRLSAQERLTLIEQLWASLDDADVPASPAQRAELERRFGSFEQDRGAAVTWYRIEAELARRCP